ncbi:MAG: hypothetical protein Q9193_002460 [Seirophora villosa]
MSSGTWLVICYSDNNLINGKMNFNCSGVHDGRPCTNAAPLARFKFKTGNTHRLRLINAGAAGQQLFSIDEHEMTVIANDFVPVEPYTTKTVFLGVKTALLANVRYQKLNGPMTDPWPYTDRAKCNNDDLSLTVPYYAITPDPDPGKILEIVVDQLVNATGHLEWRMNRQAFRGNYNNPLLLLAQGKKNRAYAPEWNVVEPGVSKSVRLVVQNNSTVSHPMHLHGHDMYILHEGDGAWDGHTITNPQNPQRRDVQMLRPGGHIVVQYEQDNPGVWPFHCHIAWHLSLGLSLNLLERPEDILSMSIPDIMRQNCDGWDRYTGRAVVDQIDSGIKD